MHEVVWETEYSVETEASVRFAWDFLTNVNNWTDPPARFVIDGPFHPGSTGMTVLPEQDPVRWSIREVEPERSYTIETQLDRAVLSSQWRFEALSADKTRLVQRLLLSGENARSYSEEISNAFGSNLSAGMEKIASSITHAAASTRVSAKEN